MAISQAAHDYIKAMRETMGAMRKTMEQEEHTKGPWEFERMRHTPQDKDRRCGWVINECDEKPPLPKRICDMRSTPEKAYAETEANAKLISASPELLEACKALARAYQNGEDNGGSMRWEDVDDAWILAQAAILKAIHGE